MTQAIPKLSIGRLIMIPAVITFAVTLLRLVGELQHWSPRFFSRAAGGAGAIIGIVWLVPIFGIYFAMRLNQAGHGPKSRGRAIGLPLAALAAEFVLFFVISRISQSVAFTIVSVNVVSVLCLLIAYQGWSDLGKVGVAYGLAARIPVAILMLIAMAANWGTHYELGPPGLPELGLASKWVLIGLLPQLLFWVAFTVIIGSLFGSVALLFQKRPQLSEPEPVRSDAKKLGAHS